MPSPSRTFEQIDMKERPELKNRKEKKDRKKERKIKRKRHRKKKKERQTEREKGRHLDDRVARKHSRSKHYNERVPSENETEG